MNTGAGMSDFDVDKEIKALRSKVFSLDKQQKFFDVRLKQYGYERGEVHSELSSAIIKAVENEEDNAFVGELAHYLDLSRNFSEDMDLFFSLFDETNGKEVIRQIALKRAEQRHFWSLWRDKLVRWTFGVVLAVVLYSVFVGFSESENEYLNWIHIPIKDWFPK